MKKILLILMLILPTLGLSQNTEISKTIKRNQNFMWNRTYISPIWYPRIYPNYFIGPTYYYPNTINRTTKTYPNLNLSVGLNLPILYNESKVGFGVYMTFGKEIVFITSFDMISINPYIHYSNISYRDVLSWGDKYMGKEYENYSTNFGIGKRFGNFVPYVSLFIFSQTEYWVYFDDTYILSNSGYYTIYADRRNKIGPAFGTLYDINKLQLNVNFNPQRNIISLGVGMKF